MDAVAAPNGDGILMLVGTCLERIEQGVEIGDEEVGGLHELHVEAGVEHVGGVRPRMEKARLGADMLGDGGEDAMTSCFTSRSIASMRSISNPPRFLAASAASFGIRPSSAMASAA